MRMDVPAWHAFRVDAHIDMQTGLMVASGCSDDPPPCQVDPPRGQPLGQILHHLAVAAQIEFESKI